MCSRSRLLTQAACLWCFSFILATRQYLAAMGSDSDSSESGNTVSQTTRNKVLPAFEQKRQKFLPGAMQKPRRNPPWYSARILEEERPDLAGPDGKLHLEKEEAGLLDVFIRAKGDLQTGDLIITDDNLDEDDRKFNRYVVQLKYNEGRYTSLYLISKEVCKSNETVEQKTLFAMKTSSRPYSVNILLRMKREMRILNELKNHRCPYSPILLESGRVADLPFIVMSLLDRNFEKLREQTTIFLPSTVYYVAHEVMSAIAFLHSLKYVHRDIKPANICIGAGPMSTRIYLIDYGDTVKQGKKIRYGTPDSYTLPYWSIDAHKRLPARHRVDVESWFYVLIDLLAPGSLPWAKMYKEKDIESEKMQFWTGKLFMLDSPYVFAIFDLIRKFASNFNHETAKRIVREAIDCHLKGPMVLEWAPNTRVNLPPLTGPRVVKSNWKPHTSAKSGKEHAAKVPCVEERRSKKQTEVREVNQRCHRTPSALDRQEAEVPAGEKNIPRVHTISRYEAPGANVDAVVVEDSAKKKKKRRVFTKQATEVITQQTPTPQTQQQGNSQPPRNRAQQQNQNKRSQRPSRPQGQRQGAQQHQRPRSPHKMQRRNVANHHREDSRVRQRS